MATSLSKPKKTTLNIRRLKSLALKSLAILGGVCFLLSIVFDEPLEPEYVEYFSNPVKVVFEPLPIRRQEPNWSGSL